MIWLSINYIRWNFSKIWSRFWTEAGGGGRGITFIIPNNCLKNFPPSVGCRHIVAGRIWLLTLDPLCTHGYRVLSNHGCPLPPPPSQVKHSQYRGVILSHGTRISEKKKTKVSLLSLYKYEDREVACLRVYAQTICNPENQGFCFQLCTVAHFIGILLLPWFSCSLVYFPNNWIRFSGFCLLHVLLKSWMSYFIYRTSTRKEKKRKKVRLVLISDVNKSKKTKKSLGF